MYSDIWTISQVCAQGYAILYAEVSLRHPEALSGTVS